MMKEFYVLRPYKGNRFGRKYAYAEQVDPVFYAPAEKCPVCDSPISGKKWIPPHRIKLSKPNPESWGDFIWGSGFTLIVSERFKEIYQDNNLTGVSKFYPPLEIIDTTEKQSINGNHGKKPFCVIDIVWGAANQDDSRSGVTYYEPEKELRCSFCRSGGYPRKQSSIVIEENSWDGSDIFTPRGAPTSIVISLKLKEIIEDNNLSNYLLIPSREYSYDDRNVSLSPKEYPLHFPTN